MRIVERPRAAAALLLAVAVLATGGLLSWQALRSDSAAFFPHEAPGEWILYPMAPAPVRPKGDLEAVFTRPFVLEHAPERARLVVRIHRTGSVSINGRPVPFASSDGVRWKEPRSGDVAGWLRAGENAIEVRAVADEGPPALWLALEADGVVIASDASWTATLMGAEEAPARLARTPLLEWARAEPDPARLDRENPRPLDALRARALEIAALLALAGAAGTALALALRRRGERPLPARAWLAAWLVVGAAWLALFAHNQGLHGAWGFDASAHRIYVKVVLQEGRLPLADEGWQMYQPPLYYLLSAGWLALGGFGTVDQSAIDWLRWLGFGAGMLQAAFVLLALRELFPERPGLVLAGFVFATSLPVGLYLFQLVTNEILAATFASGALWWTIRLLRRPGSGLASHAVLGVFLGLAMLAKFSALIPVVLCTGVLFAQRLLAEPRALGRHAKALATTLALLLAVCGWHYARVALHFGGNPFVGNWHAESGQAWWQDPGYHVREDYTRFGRALERPLMSAVAGVPDALYSTLFGDGMMSGVGRVHTPPPWDLERMAAGYALALLPCVSLLFGVLLGFVDFVRRPRAERFLALAVLGATAYALANMTLRLPYYAQAKSFYGLSALVPMGFFFALGFEALALRTRVLAPLAIAWLGAWAVLAYGSFVGDRERLPLDPMQMEVVVDEGRYIALAREANARGDREAAIEALRRALEHDPDLGGVGQMLAELLRLAGRDDEALTAVRAALRASPTGQRLHLLAGELWMERGEPGRAAFHFDAAARLLPATAIGHIDEARRGELAALRAAGRFADAMSRLGELRAAGKLSPAVAPHYAELLLEAPPPWRDPALALELAEAAARDGGDAHAAALDALAAALAANGRAGEAARAQERALALWRERREPARIARAEERLAGYRGTVASGQRTKSSAASP